MEINQLPNLDLRNVAPGCCCPKIDPDDWDGLDLHFRDKPFVRCHTASFFYKPLNMGKVFGRTFAAIKGARADEESQFVILSDDSSRWRGEHFFSVKREVPGLDNVRMTGDFMVKVFEGPYRDAAQWVDGMRKTVGESGKRMERLFFFYTTCPKCAVRYGKNYVIGIAQVA